jgi:hypothetical protein
MWRERHTRTWEILTFPQKQWGSEIQQKEGRTMKVRESDRSIVLRDGSTDHMFARKADEGKGATVLCSPQRKHDAET